MIVNAEGALEWHLQQADIDAGYMVLVRDVEGNALVWITPEGRLKTKSAYEDHATDTLAG